MLSNAHRKYICLRAERERFHCSFHHQLPAMPPPPSAAAGFGMFMEQQCPHCGERAPNHLMLHHHMLTAHPPRINAPAAPTLPTTSSAQQNGTASRVWLNDIKQLTFQPRKRSLSPSHDREFSSSNQLVHENNNVILNKLGQLHQQALAAAESGGLPVDTYKHKLALYRIGQDRRNVSCKGQKHHMQHLHEDIRMP